MSYQDAIKQFEGRDIRMSFDEEQQEWYFSVVDAITVLTDSKDAAAYWRKIKQRMKAEGSETVTNCHALKMRAIDGKMRMTDVVNKDQLSQFAQSISSPKTKSFIEWIEQTDKSDDGAALMQDSEDQVIGGEIVLYQSDEKVNLQVRLEDDTVWLTQAQIVDLFQSSKGNISEHIANIFEQEELEEGATVRDFRTVQSEGGRMVTRMLTYYNLDVIISVGFRVNAKRGVRFRQWANRVLREHLLRGYTVNQRLSQLENRIDERFVKQHDEIQSIKQTLSDHQEKIDFFVRTNQPPVEGIFFDGQIFDAYRFVNDQIRKAKSRIVLIDNYVDDTVLAMLDKRAAGVTATIYTQHVSQQLQLDIDRHNAQYDPIVVEHFNRAHDRFLLIDEEVYHIGASLKDLGKKWFAFTLMHDITAAELISRISGSTTVNIEQ